MNLQEALKIVKEELKPSLTNHCYGIMTYGSAAREEDYVEGWSDVDIIIVADYDFCCPRKFYEELGSDYTAIRERMEEKGVKWGIKDEIGFSIYDVGSIVSGRYNWMVESFKEHLRNSGKIIWGEDFRDILSGKSPKANEESGLAYSLWRSRITASTLDYNERHNEEQFKYEFKKSTKSLGNFFRNAVVLKAGSLREDAKSGIAKQFLELFPEINKDDVKEILNAPYRWPEINHDEMEDLFFKGLGIKEIAVRAFARNVQSL